VASATGSRRAAATIDVVKRLLAACLALLPATVLAGANSTDFSVGATFVAAKKKSAPASISILFKPASPDVRINAEPGPRLKLDPGQKVLTYTPPPGVMAPPSFDPAFAKYLDLSKPLSFDVTHVPGTGKKWIDGSVVYFYCSKKEGWCKKGTSSFEVSVD
jgi:hypothetical protein